MEPRYVLIIGFHFVVAFGFGAFALRNALLGDVVGAVLQGVIGVLVLILGVGVARSV